MLYLYGFTGADAAPPPGEVLGVAESQVKLLDMGPVQAVVSTVEEERFEPERVESNLHDLDWLGEQGALHERVVTWFVDHGTILPARFLTLHSGEEALMESVAPRLAVVERRLRELEGLREWNLKVTFLPDVVREHLSELSERAAALEREMDEAGPGRRYLLTQQRERLVRDEVRTVVRERALQIYRDLAASAERARRISPPKGGDPGGSVALNAALLVARDKEEDVRSRAGALHVDARETGILVELTGPWAPYRFVEEEEDDGGSP